MWVEPDLNMPDGESTARSMLIGKRWYQQHYGVDVRIGWNPDSFGYNWQLPQIYKKSGIDYFVTQKMAWNDTNQLPFKLFWWESPDGSKVLTYFPHGYANTNLNPVRLSAGPGAGADHGSGHDEHDGPVRRGRPRRRADARHARRGLHWMQPDKVAPKMEFGTAQPWFLEDQEADCAAFAGVELPQHRAGLPRAAAGRGSDCHSHLEDELYFEFHRGVYTTQASMKRNMRESAGVGAECGEIRVAGVAGWRQLSRR